MESFKAQNPSDAAPKQPLHAPFAATSQPSSRDEAWSTAKCMRILRPLEASLNSLRRLRAKTPRLDAASRASSLAQPKEAVLAPQDKTVGPILSGEPDWIKSNANRKREKTYSRRGRPRKDSNNVSIAPHTVQITMPTPRVARYAQSHDVCGNAVPLAAAEANGVISKSSIVKPFSITFRFDPLWRILKKDALAQEAIRNLKASDSQAHPFVEGLCTSLYSVYSLRARGQSNNSLLDLCLRKVPSYIRNEETEILKDSEPNSAAALAEAGAVAHDIYEDIGELLPADPRSREVMVISQVRSLLQAAIREGIFNDDSLRLVIRTCIASQCYEEAEHFIDTYLTTRQMSIRSFHQQLDIFGLKPMQDLVCIKLASGNDGSYHRILRSLFISGSYSIGSLLSLSQMFALVVRRASECNEYQSLEMDTCLELCEWALSKLSGASSMTLTPKAQRLAEVRSMIKDFMEHLTGVCLMQEYEACIQDPSLAHDNDTVGRLKLLKRILEIPLRVARAGCPGELSADGGDLTVRNTIIIALAAIVAHGSVATNDESLVRQVLRGFSYIEKIWQYQHAQEGLSSSITRFLQYVIQACKLDWNHKVFGFSLAMIRDFLGSDFCEEELLFDEQLHFGMIFARAASQNAEHRGDVALFNLAKDFEGFMIAQGLVPPLCVSETSLPEASEFAWDDGLSEWVLKTPAQRPVLNLSHDRSSSIGSTEDIFDTGGDASSISSVSQCGDIESMDDRSPRKRSFGMIGEEENIEEEEEDELSGLFICGIKPEVFVQPTKQHKAKRVKTAFQALMEAGSDDL